MKILKMNTVDPLSYPKYPLLKRDKNRSMVKGKQSNYKQIIGQNQQRQLAPSRCYLL